MVKANIDLYLDYISSRGAGMSVFRALVNKYQIQSGIYPGSYVHITPSLFISEMYYIDSDKKANAFFKNHDEIKAYLEANKSYPDDLVFKFEASDFTKPLMAEKCHYDLMISLYSGFISYYCKAYLRRNGLLLANDSHGDATLAYHDPDYDFIGVVLENENEVEILQDKLDVYFKMKSGKAIDLEKVKDKMKGPNYKEKVEYYLFRKIV